MSVWIAFVLGFLVSQVRSWIWKDYTVDNLLMLLRKREKECLILEQRIKQIQEEDD